MSTKCLPVELIPECLSDLPNSTLCRCLLVSHAFRHAVEPMIYSHLDLNALQEPDGLQKLAESLSDSPRLGRLVHSMTFGGQSDFGEYTSFEMWQHVFQALVNVRTLRIGFIQEETEWWMESGLSREWGFAQALRVAQFPKLAQVENGGGCQIVNDLVGRHDSITHFSLRHCSQDEEAADSLAWIQTSIIHLRAPLDGILALARADRLAKLKLQSLAVDDATRDVQPATIEGLGPAFAAIGYQCRYLRVDLVTAMSLLSCTAPLSGLRTLELRLNHRHVSVRDALQQNIPFILSRTPQLSALVLRCVAAPRLPYSQALRYLGEWSSLCPHLQQVHFILLNSWHRAGDVWVQADLSEPADPTAF